VLCRLLYKLSLRNLAQMSLLLGFEFTHEAVREWEQRFAPLLADQIRRRLQGKLGRRWYVDERYLKVQGRWCYLYRAIDRDGNLVDSMLSATRERDAAQRFFRSARSMVNSAPTQVTTDGHDSYPRAIRETLGDKVKHRFSAYANRRIERDHRAARQRYYPMLGFGALPSAQRFCRAFEEVRQYFRPCRKQKQVVSLSEGRRQFLSWVFSPSNEPGPGGTGGRESA
jgi:putative transposase